VRSAAAPSAAIDALAGMWVVRVGAGNSDLPFNFARQLVIDDLLRMN
jgi:hypothetical protein